jgi:hypothetical protein
MSCGSVGTHRIDTFDPFEKRESGIGPAVADAGAASKWVSNTSSSVLSSCVTSGVTSGVTSEEPPRPWTDDMDFRSVALDRRADGLLTVAILALAMPSTLVLNRLFPDLTNLPLMGSAAGAILLRCLRCGLCSPSMPVMVFCALNMLCWWLGWMNNEQEVK